MILILAWVNTRFFFARASNWTMTGEKNYVCLSVIPSVRSFVRSSVLPFVRSSVSPSSPARLPSPLELLLPFLAWSTKREAGSEIAPSTALSQSPPDSRLIVTPNQIPLKPILRFTLTSPFSSFHSSSYEKLLQIKRSFVLFCKPFFFSFWFTCRYLFPIFPWLFRLSIPGFSCSPYVSFHCRSRPRLRYLRCCRRCRYRLYLQLSSLPFVFHAFWR